MSFEIDNFDIYIPPEPPVTSAEENDAGSNSQDHKVPETEIPIATNGLTRDEQLEVQKQFAHSYPQIPQTKAQAAELRGGFDPSTAVAGNGDQATADALAAKRVSESAQALSTATQNFSNGLKEGNFLDEKMLTGKDGVYNRGDIDAVAKSITNSYSRRFLVAADQELKGNKQDSTDYVRSQQISGANESGFAAGDTNSDTVARDIGPTDILGFKNLASSYAKEVRAQGVKINLESGLSQKNLDGLHKYFQGEGSLPEGVKLEATNEQGKALLAHLASQVKPDQLTETTKTESSQAQVKPDTSPIDVEDVDFGVAEELPSSVADTTDGQLPELDIELPSFDEPNPRPDHIPVVPDGVKDHLADNVGQSRPSQVTTDSGLPVGAGAGMIDPREAGLAGQVDSVEEPSVLDRIGSGFKLAQDALSGKAVALTETLVDDEKRAQLINDTVDGTLAFAGDTKDAVGDMVADGARHLVESNIDKAVQVAKDNGIELDQKAVDHLRLAGEHLLTKRNEVVKDYLQKQKESLIDKPIEEQKAEFQKTLKTLDYLSKATVAGFDAKSYQPSSKIEMGASLLAYSSEEGIAKTSSGILAQTAKDQKAELDGQESKLADEEAKLAADVLDTVLSTVDDPAQRDAIIHQALDLVKKDDVSLADLASLKQEVESSTNHPDKLAEGLSKNLSDYLSSIGISEALQERVGLNQERLEEILSSPDPASELAKSFANVQSEILKDPSKINDYLELGSKLLQRDSIRDALTAKLPDAIKNSGPVQAILSDPTKLEELKLTAKELDALDTLLDAERALIGEGKDITDAFVFDAHALSMQGKMEKILGMAKGKLFGKIEQNDWNKGWATLASKGFLAQLFGKGITRAAIGRSQHATRGAVVDDLPQVALLSMGSNSELQEAREKAGLDTDALLEQAGGKMSDSEARKLLATYANKDPNGTLTAAEQRQIARAYFSLNQSTTEAMIKENMDGNTRYIDKYAKTSDIQDNGRNNIKSVMKGLMTARQMMLKSRSYDMAAMERATDQALTDFGGYAARLTDTLGLETDDLRTAAAGHFGSASPQLPAGYLQTNAADIYGDQFDHLPGKLAELDGKFAFYRDADGHAVAINKDTGWAGTWRTENGNVVAKAVDAQVEQSLRNNLSALGTTVYGASNETNATVKLANEILDRADAYDLNGYQETDASEFYGDNVPEKAENFRYYQNDDGKWIAANKNGNWAREWDAENSQWKDIEDKALETNFKTQAQVDPNQDAKLTMAQVRENFKPENNRFATDFDAEADSQKLASAANTSPRLNSEGQGTSSSYNSSSSTRRSSYRKPFYGGRKMGARGMRRRR